MSHKHYPPKPNRWRPVPGSLWKHSETEGLYRVMAVACNADVKTHYAENVVYMREDGDGELFTRNLDDWQTPNKAGVPRFVLVSPGLAEL